MGGEIMFVEATRMDGEGKVILTGQLGDVMKESANLAMNTKVQCTLQRGELAVCTTTGQGVSLSLDLNYHSRHS
jgi:ATP-dependent Lon protease